MFSLGHGLAELCRILEHADQDLQTVQVRVLRRDHLKNGLTKGKRGQPGGERTHVCYPHNIQFIPSICDFACFIHPTRSRLTDCSVMNVFDTPVLYDHVWNAI